MSEGNDRKRVVPKGKMKNHTGEFNQTVNPN